MKRGLVSEIAFNTDLAVSTVSNIINRRRRPSAAVAKRLQETTGVSLEVWLFGDRAEIEKELSGASEAGKS